MNNKRLYVVVGLIVLALAAWALASHLRATPVDPAVAQQFTWKVADAGFDKVATTTPLNTITLTIAGVDVPIGTYPGSCNLIDNDKVKLLAGEVSGVMCLYKGDGQEIGIFAQGDKLSLEQGVVTKDENGIKSRDQFTELKKL